MSQRISHSVLDPWIGPRIQRLYPHLRIPRWFPPEGIVLSGHLMAILGAVGFAFSLQAWWGGLLAAVGVAGNHFADCIDGTHARKTGQCRHGGELLDHFTDPLSFVYWLVGIGVALGRLDWALVAVICLFAHAVLTNIRAKLTDRFELSAFGPTEFKTLLMGLGIVLAALTYASVDAVWISRGLFWFYASLASFGVFHLLNDLRRSVREVNQSSKQIDTNEWITRDSG